MADDPPILPARIVQTVQAIARLATVPRQLTSQLIDTASRPRRT